MINLVLVGSGYSLVIPTHTKRCTYSNITQVLTHDVLILIDKLPIFKVEIDQSA